MVNKKKSGIISKNKRLLKILFVIQLTNDDNYIMNLA